MIILAIETSCDDTCISVIRISGRKQPKIKVLSNIVSSQVEIHKKYGGVYPLLAKREHEKNLPVVLEKSLKEAKNPKVDAIAVTTGPGLEPCLWSGVNFAKKTAKDLKVPIIPVNHIEAHIYANFLNLNSEDFKKMFPALALIVSGGHTQIVLVKGFGKYKILGETRDDAAGECFDKVARMLGLEYPGGPIIEKIAKEYDKRKSKIKVDLPRPMIYQKNYDFSFSGLKTAALYHFKNQKPKIKKSKEYIRAMAYELQSAIIDVLVYKTIKAAKEYKVKTIILGGGVSANSQLRKQFKAEIKRELTGVGYKIPDKKYSTDNALMIAIVSYYRWLGSKTKSWKKISVNANLRL
ncbi:MAG: tRNA (adenosine(37)-N6)-threonylcarbamoyltransferase complex transferase subunit TsaD [Patescibacteria group bacterium]|nr:tRNA (adenosine(37)-N6)-threonylcarbamoyltransferase complex transferase subunit TsaD [Patescibacteria group bacterium]